MVIRPLEAGEWPQMKRLIRQACAELERFGTPNMAEPLAHIVFTGMTAGQHIVVAEEGGQLVGYVAWAMLPGMPRGLVTGAGTYVEPAHRRKGISRLMRSAATAYWREHGGTYVRGSVAAGNEAGRSMAEDSGWRIVGHEIELAL